MSRLRVVRSGSRGLSRRDVAAVRSLGSRVSRGVNGFGRSLRSRSSRRVRLGLLSGLLVIVCGQRGDISEQRNYESRRNRGRTLVIVAESPVDLA